MNRTRDRRKAIFYFALLGASLMLLPTGCESGAGGSDGGHLDSSDAAPGRRVQEVRVVSPPIEARLSGDPIRMEAEWKPGKLDLTGGPLKIDGKIEGGLELKKPDWRLDGTLTVREPEEGVAVRVDLKKPDWQLPVHWEGGPVQVAVSQPKEPFSVQLIGWPTKEQPLMVQVANPPPAGGGPVGNSGCNCKGGGTDLGPVLVELFKFVKGGEVPPTKPDGSEVELRKALAEAQRKLEDKEKELEETQGKLKACKDGHSDTGFVFIYGWTVVAGCFGGLLAQRISRDLNERRERERRLVAQFPMASKPSTSDSPVSKSPTLEDPYLGMKSAMFWGFAAAFFVPGVIFLFNPESLSDAGKNGYHQLGFFSLCMIAASIGAPFVTLAQQLVMFRLVSKETKEDKDQSANAAPPAAGPNPPSDASGPTAGAPSPSVTPPPTRPSS